MTLTISKKLSYALYPCPTVGTGDEDRAVKNVYCSKELNSVNHVDDITRKRICALLGKKKEAKDCSFKGVTATIIYLSPGH